MKKISRMCHPLRHLGDSIVFFYDLFKVSQFRTRMTYKILMSEGTIADYVALRKDILYIEENPGSIPTVLHAASPTDSFF